eukprot:Nitzschia sp. Nitz4//NODE_389_length_21930_cov_67.393920//19646//20743//NITZ4_additional_000054-RA//1//CDS//3329531886//2248//frame0
MSTVSPARPTITMDNNNASRHAAAILPLGHNTIQLGPTTITTRRTFADDERRTGTIPPVHSTYNTEGVVVDDEVATTFNGFKLQAAGYKLRYYIYEIVDKKTIKIEKSGDRSKTYEDFCDDLPENSCRYGLIDLEFTTDDGRPTSKLVFITWNPDTGSIRDKMLYSGSKESIKAALSGVGIHINATDRAELDLESSILPVVKKFA